MIDFDNHTEHKIDETVFEKILQTVAPSKNLELIVVGDDEIREINLEYRKLDKATDVLSFPIKESKTNFIGSIIISADTAKRVADELGHSFEKELQILFIHGLLHTIGFDHETDNGQMREKETQIASILGLTETMLSR
ncbi:MAG TPA: rRNA maturation RNase YbeY [Campylobacterales bacterium]|nr:rRNA maturation RNase YbeY [Campylobacterales bacterium]